MTGLQVFYDGDFDQAMEEAGPATKENINDAMGAYIAMFHESFFLIDGPSISVSNEELYRWLNWCVFYGRPRHEYPLAERLDGNDTAKAAASRDSQTAM